MKLELRMHCGTNKHNSGHKLRIACTFFVFRFRLKSSLVTYNYYRKGSLKKWEQFFCSPLTPKIAPKMPQNHQNSLLYFFLFEKKLFPPKIWCNLENWSIWHILQVCTFKNKKSTPKKLKNLVYFLPPFYVFCIFW